MYYLPIYLYFNCSTYLAISNACVLPSNLSLFHLPIYLSLLCGHYLSISIVCVLSIYLYCVYYLSISIVCVLPIYLNCMCTYILYGSIFSLGPTLCSLCIGITSYLIGVHNATPTFGISNFGINR